MQQARRLREAHAAGDTGKVSFLSTGHRRWALPTHRAGRTHALHSQTQEGGQTSTVHPTPAGEVLKSPNVREVIWDGVWHPSLFINLI